MAIPRLEQCKRCGKEKYPNQLTYSEHHGGKVCIRCLGKYVPVFGTRMRQTLPWNEYPIGTKAHACTGGYWIKVHNGWKWCAGNATFPTPGGDAVGVCVELPCDQAYTGEING